MPEETRPAAVRHDLHEEIRSALDRQRLHRLDPWALKPYLLTSCRVRILVVTDGGGSFGGADFGLSDLLGVLAVPPGPWVRFEVTKAHRRNDPDADLNGFRFDRHDLAAYDQLWLIGVERAGSEITDAEVRAVAEFMDGGGGVFATGDHEDLGVALCGRVPRVRSMRKWYWPNAGPNGEPVAPSVGGPNRYDTLREGGDAGIQFDDQSDDVPQRISPRLYAGIPWNHFFFRGYPHPVLCGPRGPIRVLPDHPHEGECYVPGDLSATLTYAGQSFAEYPGGVAPEVIATSTVLGRAVDANKGPLNPRAFGAIGAYDGHRAGVGRVVVDATWHHLFNVNLTGELGDPGPVKNLGFLASPAGQAAYDDIKAYFRNVAVWLARPESHSCMVWRALWWLRWHHVLVMDLRPPFLARSSALELGELVRVGGVARDVLGRAAGQCNVLRWTGWEIVRVRRPELWKHLQHVLDPWVQGEREPGGLEPQPDVVVPLHAEMLHDAVLGGLLYAIATAFPVGNDEARDKAEQVDFAEVVEEHLARSLELLAEHSARSAGALQEFSRSLSG